MVTNALGSMRIVETLQDLVRPTGTIAVMSSSLGSVADNETGGWEVYRGSEAALNMLMRSFAARHKTDYRSFLIVDPSWVRTDVGGPGAALDIETSVSSVVDALAAQSDHLGLGYLNYQGK
jgi:NAD(P)-dependent dehydrogenase (short-subunit alcohol dehydrogenase family)